jgi:hypothetical protein
MTIITALIINFMIILWSIIGPIQKNQGFPIPLIVWEDARFLPSFDRNISQQSLLLGVLKSASAR